VWLEIVRTDTNQACEGLVTRPSGNRRTTTGIIGNGGRTDRRNEWSGWFVTLKDSLAGAPWMGHGWVWLPFHSAATVKPLFPTGSRTIYNDPSTQLCSA
jgi:hypothetical protein